MKCTIALICLLYSFTVLADTTTTDETLSPYEELNFPDYGHPPPTEGEHHLPEKKLYGYDDGFYIHNKDNTFSLLFNGTVQARYLYSHVEGLDDYQRFEVARTKLFFTGHFIDDSWEYVFGMLAGPNGTFAVDEGYIAKAFTPNTWVQAGQFNVPLFREFLISVTRQLAVERTIVGQYFSVKDTNGVLVGTEQGPIKFTVSANNGYFHPSADENQSVEDEEFQDGNTYAFLTRLEYKPFGSWKELRDFNSPYQNEVALLFGIGAGYQRNNNTVTQDQEYTTGTADITLQGSGWSTFAMFAANKNQKSDEPTVLGAVIQGGLYVDPQKHILEIFSRYEWGNGTTEEDLSLATIGGNYFIDPKHLKLTVDFGYAFSAVDPIWADNIGGWRAAEEHGQWVARTQLQIVI
ncbi:MAG: hypothetical protein ABSF18_05635 [Gammaproteobacteria bacterium]